MQHYTMNFQKAGFPKILIDYINRLPDLRVFYTTFPDLEPISSTLKERKFDADKRNTLCQIIAEQYQTANIIPPENLHILAQPGSCAVTTGHQLCIMTGPIYFVYKIITTLQLAKQLTKTNPAHPVVPIFWLASEDHDFTEVNHFHLFGKKYEWNEANFSGAVGRYNITNIKPWLDSIQELPQKWKEAYLTSNTWAEATRKLVHSLFGDKGLLILDADDARLKKYFVPYMLDDLLHHTAFHAVTQTTQALESKGYKSQIRPRAINLFYLKDNLRERIEKKDTQYEVLHTDLIFSTETIQKELTQHPERFSPNVVLRPLYQEVILPNIAYVGGPAEIAYWLQLGDLFKRYDIPFPALVLRNSALLITPSQSEKIKKLGLSTTDLFGDAIQLKKRYTMEHSQNPLTFPEQKKVISRAFEEITQFISQTDPSLVGMVKAEMHKTIKAIEHIEKKVEKAAEHQQATQIQQIIGLLNKLFPNQTLQERHDNILNFTLNHPNLLETLYETFNPFVFEFQIIEL